MTTQRTTKEIVTPGGHKVVVYDYITGGEMRRITTLYMEGIKSGDILKTGETGNKVAMENVPVTTLLKAQELALEMLIVSVDGKIENAYQECMNLRGADLDVVIAELDKYTTGGDSLKKNEP